MKVYIIACVVLISLAYGALSLGHSTSNGKKENEYPTISGDLECNDVQGFTNELRDEIKAQAVYANKIIDIILNGTEKSSTYNELALFCDTFGPRLSGSKSLENAIEYMTRKMRVESRLKVHDEPATIPKWEVYNQWAEMIQPRRHNMSILALGTSVATNGTIEAEVIVVNSFDHLRSLGRANIEGKIVVYNYHYEAYPNSVVYRTKGALEAAKYGARAALIRSVAPFSIYSAHTGMGSQTIPTAAITLEDADFIQRIVKRNQKVVIRLFIDAQNLAPVQSSNVVGDIVGTSRPDEIVLVSGHIDSWYNTDGAMDDGGGMMISYKALDVLSKLKLSGKRTIRAVLWTSEEFGLVGAQQYFNNHRDELQNFKVVIESDEGTFKPLGFGFKNLGKVGRCVLQEILNLTARLGTATLSDKYEGSDIELFTDVGVPGLSLLNENSKYFWFHHSSGDSMSVQDPDNLDRATGLFAITSLVLANLDVDLRN